MLRIRSLCAIGLMLAVAASARAHSIAVIAARPATAPGGKVTVFLAWGHLLPVDELVSGEDIETYELIAPSGNTIPLNLDGRSLQANEVIPDETGLYHVSLAKKPAVFTRYTDSSGNGVFAMGAKDEVELPEGAEVVLSARSSQFAKALIVSGSSEQGAPGAPLGHPLEIVLDSAPGPLGFSPDEPVRVRVLLRGEPAAGVQVFAASTTRNPDGVPEVSAETDDEGRASLELFEPGSWVLSASHQADAPEEFQSSFETESFLATFTIPVADDE